MAREQTGSMRWGARNKTWMGRIRGADGARTPWCDLGTDNETLAHQRLAQWIETGVPPRAKARELFADAATRIMADQEKSGFAGASERKQRVNDFANPLLGHREVEQIEQHHLRSVLASMTSGANKHGRSYAADTVHHMRTDLSRIFKTLVSEGTLRYCVATDLELPDDVEHDARQHKIVSDEHVVQFLRGRGTQDELGMLVLISRWVGGQRPSDIHAGDWSHVDVVNWLTMLVRRPKTEAKPGRKRGHRKGRRRASRSFEYVRHEIPPDVREPLKAWYIKQGSPTGPIFPARTGKNAGKRKASRGISYAKPFRDALWEEGIVSPLPGYETAVGEDRRNYCAYQVDTDETRAADFYSIRRAYITGLALAGVNEQLAMLASGHNGKSPVMHRGYLVVDTISVPSAALPTLAQPAPEPPTEPAPPPPTEPAPPPPPSSDEVAPATSARLESVLEGLSALLQRALGAGIDPGAGSIEAFTAGIDPAKTESFHQRARKDSNLRHPAPEAVAGHVTAPKDTEPSRPEPDRKPIHEAALTQQLGQSSAPLDPYLESLRSAGRAAFEGSDWASVAALGALIDKRVQALAAAALPPVTNIADARKRRDGEAGK